jgi:hypothetical protein
MMKPGRAASRRRESVDCPHLHLHLQRLPLRLLHLHL